VVSIFLSTYWKMEDGKLDVQEEDGDTSSFGLRTPYDNP
jgi:hypothetical protein